MTSTVAFAVGHHGEILQGLFRDRDGHTHRGLVTLPLPRRFVVATVRRREAGSALLVPRHKSKAGRAVELLLADLQREPPPIELTLNSNIPEGYGLGSSTADVVASIRAVAKFMGTAVSAGDIFRLAVRAESASDSTMFGRRARLACQREAILLERFSSRLPAFSLLSLNSAPDNPVNTLEFAPANYSAEETDEFEELRKLLRRAIDRDRPDLLGNVATSSALINQRYLPQPNFDAILHVARRMKALGVQVAHSGRMVGIMLYPSYDTKSKTFRDAVQTLAQFHLLPEFYSARQLAASPW